MRQGDAVRVYVNSCPHIGVPLDWAPDRFLSHDRQRIICAMHGAEFRITDGVCTAGPCLGDRLEAVMIEIKDGALTASRRRALASRRAQAMTDTLFPVTPEIAAAALVNAGQHAAMTEEAARDPDAFWKRESNRITWMTAPTKMRSGGFDGEVKVGGSRTGCSMPPPTAWTATSSPAAAT